MLFDAGRDDALLSSTDGAGQASSADALASAITAIETAIPHTRVARVERDEHTDGALPHPA